METVGGFLPKTDKGYEVFGMHDLSSSIAYGLGDDSPIIGTVVVSKGHSEDVRWGRMDGRPYGGNVFGNLIPAPKEKVPFNRETCPRGVIFRHDYADGWDFIETARNDESIAFETGCDTFLLDWKELRDSGQWSTDGVTWHKCETESK